MVVSMVGACGVRLIWVATIFQTYHTPTMLYISYPVSWTITAAVHIAFFFFIRKHAYAKSSGMQNLSGAPKQEKNASEAA